MSKPCSIDGCNNKAKKRTWCEMHYRRWRVHGSPNTTLKRSKGGGFIDGGYRGWQVNGKKYIEHLVIAEKALGKPLPPGSIVHHANENKLDNRPENLVICPNRAYHVLLHKRLRALHTCGNPSWLWCVRCRDYFPPEQFKRYPYKSQPFHEHKRWLS